MRDVVVLTYCDVCLKEYDRQESGTPFQRITIGRLVRDIDLCSDCRKVPESFREWLVKYGEPVDKEAERNAAPGPPKSPRPGQRPAFEPATLVCLMCQFEGADAKPYKTKGSLRFHVRSAHNMGINALEAWAEERGLIPINPDRSPPLPCDLCEFMADAPQGLALHKKRNHAVVKGISPANHRRQNSEVA
jgi:hypothetical protein